ncbi:MAG: hypothetical protein ACI9LE_000577 [Paraglaciecola sp.]|jgi:hypothetical protein
MLQAGVLKGDSSEHYKTKITPHLRWFKSTYTAAAIARRLMVNNQYPAAYWGSAYIFLSIKESEHLKILTRHPK